MRRLQEKEAACSKMGDITWKKGKKEHEHHTKSYWKKGGAVCREKLTVSKLVITTLQESLLIARTERGGIIKGYLGRRKSTYQRNALGPARVSGIHLICAKNKQ